MNSTDAAHLSELNLDRLLAGETSGLEQAQAHLEGCASCQQRFSALQAEQEQSMTAGRVKRRVDDLFEKSARPVARPIFRWLPAMGATVAAGACLLAIVILFGGPSQSPQNGEVRIKGQAALQTLVIVGQKARFYLPGEKLPSGTRLGFRVSAPSGSWVKLAGISQSGPVYFVESPGGAPWFLKPGPYRQMPVSAELDQQSGDERFFAVFCPRAIDKEQLSRFLQESYPDTASAQRNLASPPPEKWQACSVCSVLVQRKQSQGAQ